MKTFDVYQPSAFDSKANQVIHDPDFDHYHWLVAPVIRTRDSDACNRSNFAVALKRLGGASDTVEVHHFGHWACGWYDLILVAPGSKAAELAAEMESDLKDYPILDDDHFTQVEDDEAQQVWENCYSVEGRIKFIRAHRHEFEFHSFADLMGCVRGKYYAGYACTLLS